MSAKPFNLLDHLEYVRLRLLRAMIAYAAAAVASFFIVPHLWPYVLPEGAGLADLVFLSPAEGFFSRMKLALALGLLVGFPFILYQVWALFTPAMKPGHRRLTVAFLPAAYALFAGGCWFAIDVVLPLALRFFLSFETESLQPQIAVGNYVNFLIGFVLPFGFVFELPVVILALARIGVLTPRILAKNRKYVIFAIFVVAAVLTPADVFSQILLAVPLCILFEVSIALARLAAPRAAGGDG